MIFAATQQCYRLGYAKTREKKVNLGHPFARVFFAFICLSFLHTAKIHAQRTAALPLCAVNTVAVAVASAASFTPKMRKINHISEFCWMLDCLDSFGCFLRAIHSFFACANSPSIRFLLFCFASILNFQLIWGILHAGMKISILNFQFSGFTAIKWSGNYQNAVVHREVT